jgi:hypothetical protein
MELIYKKGTLSSMVLGKVESNKREGTCFKLSSLHYQFLHKDKERVRHRQRGRRVIVATGPAIEAPIIATEPLTKDNLIDYMVSGCKPKEKWRYKITIHNLCFRKMKYLFVPTLLMEGVSNDTLNLINSLIIYVTCLWL